MDFNNLSSNWRKLQETFNKNPHHKSNSLPTRKRGRETANINVEAEKQLTKRRKVYLSGSRHGHTTKQMLEPRNVTRPRSSSTPSKYPSSSSRNYNKILKSAASHSNLQPADVGPLDKVNEGNSPRAVGGKYVALDCEMVGIGPPPHDISQLARVSLVNFHGEQIYDSFVIPKLPVTDYRTSVSGIIASNLEQGRPFAEIQKDVATLLKSRILVGHALKNDLSALLLSHPKRDVRDTSLHKPFREAYSGGATPSLRTLAREVLGLNDFQSASHSSVEDARVAMLLFQHDKANFDARSSRISMPFALPNASSAPQLLSNIHEPIPARANKKKPKKRKNKK